MPDMEPAADEWLTRREAAAYAKTTPGTLATFAAAKRGPKMYKPSMRKVLYRKSDLDAWITSREATE